MDANNVSGPRANILIVDDRADTRLVLKTILEDLGQNIVLMQSGENALRWLLENDCAVMLLDINMPGMDGFETAQLIRSRPRSAHIPIIFITAHAEEIHTTRGYSLGAVDYILSPVAPGVLRSKVSVFVQLFKLAQQIEKEADERVSLAREQAARAAAEKATRQARFLAGASKILSRSLDAHSLMASATRLVIPMLADESAITLANSIEITPRIVCTPEQGAAGGANTLIHDPSWADAVDEVLATGLVKFLENLPACSPDTGLRDGRSRSSDESRAQPAVERAVILPLIARGKVRGALSLAAWPSGKRFDATEIAMATDIAGRIAMALDNCLLFKEIQDANERKTEFLATLSHELRNPLAPMRTAVHAMHLAGLWPAEGRKFREMIERQLDHMTRLVDDLLDAARITRGKIQLRKEPVDLVVKITRVLETCRPLVEKYRHEVNVSLPSEPVWVEADRVRVQQIFENLIVNACKYTDPGGRVDIGLLVENDAATFRIRDSGVGIAADMMPRIWDMFVQVDASLDRARNGLGIGLSLARQLAHLHGGAIGAASEGLGKGSEFTVRLPLMVTAPAGLPASGFSATEPARASPLAGRILVVDDNRDSAESLGTLLGESGHEVALAYDGTSALEVARAFRPDLVFLDIGLPKMNGYEVARRLRQDIGLATAKFIALSGYGTAGDLARSKQAGFALHLVKPVDPKEFPSIVASVLAAPQDIRARAET